VTDPRHIALVIAGAETVLAEAAFAEELLASLGLRQRTTFAINDMIGDYPKECVAVTLHPDKLPRWLEARRRAGHPAPAAIWAHRQGNALVTNVTNDWAGSSALFAAKIALQTSHGRIILCGAPMTVSKHYLRGTHWTSAIGFRRGWNAHLADIKDYVRSCSGWTADLLGQPTAEWLTR